MAAYLIKDHQFEVEDALATVHSCRAAVCRSERGLPCAAGAVVAVAVSHQGTSLIQAATALVIPSLGLFAEARTTSKLQSAEHKTARLYIACSYIQRLACNYLVLAFWISLLSLDLDLAARRPDVQPVQYSLFTVLLVDRGTSGETSRQRRCCVYKIATDIGLVIQSTDSVLPGPRPTVFSKHTA
jgi:hypothetical protein